MDPLLEAAEIHRRVYQAAGPALFYDNVVGSRFPLVSNLFGTLDRARFLFRDTYEAVANLIRLKIDPTEALRTPLRHARLARTAWHTLPKWVRRGGVLQQETTVSQLPQVKCWPLDGGAFITLPQVYTEDADRPGWRHSNLGMYRVQLSGGQFGDHAVGLHYQIHRGIGVHHEAARRHGKALRANLFVGGPPAMTVAAMMPLPEGMSELVFAGALGGRRVRLVEQAGALPVAADADFCISGWVDPDRLAPEGPFGDHLGYYSMQHDFPLLHVEHVWHREGAIWPFTVVGRPPQEDTTFGQLVHDLTGPVIPSVLPGVKAVHAVDAAGVHPLLLAIGSERYVPYQPSTRPMELLTQAHAILGQGQMSLAKYLLIVAQQDAPQLGIHDIEGFFSHLLARIDWQRDLHFLTSTTIDTLDYTGGRLNEGSKVVMAAVGPPCRALPTRIEGDLRLPEGFRDARLVLPGVLAVGAPAAGRGGADLRRFCEHFRVDDSINRFPLVLLVDDSEFTARRLDHFLWVTFTRSNPAADIDGIEASFEQKHWGCAGSLVIDARCKPHHAPPLEVDRDVRRRVDRLFASGGPLAGIE